MCACACVCVCVFCCPTQLVGRRGIEGGKQTLALLNDNSAFVVGRLLNPAVSATVAYISNIETFSDRKFYVVYVPAATIRWPFGPPEG